MKKLKKHIHALTGAAFFVFFCTMILLLTGFTVKLPPPKEEMIIIDFEKYESDFSSSDSKEGKILSNDDNEISGKKILIQDFENSKNIESGNSETDINSINKENINNLFRNPFGKDESGNDESLLNSDGNFEPTNLYGEIGTRKRIKLVEPIAKENIFGKVILQIIVDEHGNVTEINLVSTNCNECVQPAKDAVYKWKYETLKGSGLQTGTVIIEFKQD
ncbi:MAG: energy transducer TonB [Bacteroidales bacterium]|nr:energy transducer TonB [Bacteroidales bacterium]